jgi:transposase
MVTLPKSMTSNAKAEGRFGKQDFRYVTEEDVYICPAGEKLVYHYTNEEDGLVLRRYWTNACQSCAIKRSCTTGKERRITRWEHEHILEAVQRRLDEHPEKMRQRRETLEHPFGTIKAAAGRLRDGTARTRLQSHPRDEDHGYPAAHGGNQDIVRSC